MTLVAAMVPRSVWLNIEAGYCSLLRQTFPSFSFSGLCTKSVVHCHHELATKYSVKELAAKHAAHQNKAWSRECEMANLIDVVRTSHI